MKNRVLLFLMGGVVFSSYLLACETHSMPELDSPEKSFTYENHPFPIKKLNPQILDEFIPLIMKEIAQEFSHQNDSRTLRDTRQYGFNFFKMLKSDFSYTPPPEFYQQLGAHICYAFDHEPVEFTNIILSVYGKEFHLEPHVDVNAKDRYGNAPFYFGERVYGIVIEPDPTGQIYFVQWEGNGLVPPLGLTPIYSLKEEKGTIFCLEGPLRQTPYFHGVSSVSNHRVSITFRTVERL